MKITKSALKQIIKEELARLSEQQVIISYGYKWGSPVLMSGDDVVSAKDLAEKLGEMDLLQTAAKNDGRQNLEDVGLDVFLEYYLMRKYKNDLKNIAETYAAKIGGTAQEMQSAEY